MEPKIQGQTLSIDGDMDSQRSDIDCPRSDIDPQRRDIDCQRSDIDPQRMDIDSQRSDIDPQRSDIDPQRSDIDTQRSDIDPQRSDIDCQRSDIDVDIDSLRNEHESNREWRLRRKFLEMNKNNLNVERLVCLSRCFVNIALFGCLYPRPVMEEVRGRSAGILDEVKSEKKVEAKKWYAASFVRALSDSEETAKNFQANRCKADSETVPQVNSKPVTGRLAIDNISCGTQIPKTALEGSCATQIPKTAPGGSCTTQIPKTASVNPINNNQNPKTAAVNPINKNQNPKTAAVNLINKNQNPKTASVNPSNNNQNPKTAAVNPSDNNQNPKTATNNQTTLSKELCLSSYRTEKDPFLKKIRLLAYEALNLNVVCQNAKDRLHFAANRVPVIVDYNMENIPNKATSIYFCHVLIEGVKLACERASNMKQAKTNACEATLKTIMMPKLEIVDSGNNVKILKGSDLTSDQNICQPESAQTSSFLQNSCSGSSQFTNLPTEGCSSYKESNINSISLKRKREHSKFFNDFIIVEQVDSLCEGPGNVLRRSADFNGMILEFDYFPLGGTTRCVVKIEGQVFADVVDSTKALAKTSASAQCLGALKRMCWVLKMKQAVDADSAISRDEIQNEIKLKSEHIGSENIGNKLLQKMGWSGGGVGKTGQGIAEPVSLKAVLNRQGLGLGDVTGVTADFRKLVREVVYKYVTSGNQEDLVFSNDFDIEERKVIHEESRRLNLKSTSRGKGQDRYLCISRKRSANQLFEHVMTCGGETAKYKLLPPGIGTP